VKTRVRGSVMVTAEVAALRAIGRSVRSSVWTPILQRSRQA